VIFPCGLTPTDFNIAWTSYSERLKPSCFIVFLKHSYLHTVLLLQSQQQYVIKMNTNKNFKKLYKKHTYIHTYIHTYTRLTALCLGLPGWAGTRKVKPSEARGSEWQWHQLGDIKSAPRSRQITTPAPHHSSFLQAGCPSSCPTNSVKALKDY